ncbi:MAG TPA: 5-(carboxyamino)imidazole ribonucleotide mutase [Acidobacteriota bacterium]|nr:5-(carboxyamino)imidazole ribonucleotide mutase [Acidobacteriota bacterium]
MSAARVAVVMGSISDFDVMVSGVRILQKLGIPYEVRVMSAHRSPHSVATYAAGGPDRGLEVIIAGAGGAAHLAGAIAAHTRLPVIGVPLVASALGGLDALLATVQMPGGVPVATVGVGKSGAVNAAHLAARILALRDADIADTVEADRHQQTANVDTMQTDLEERLAGEGL